ncbi:hypothetical protein DN412_32190 [Cupriavidus lacunae]|uniref:Uncharacterized protein n=1 Tax=Cupriavidus lacunae TaxID=2666307 RepID=A0A370NL51_9BURK|nr:hypothetical protein DN412_32190 [Cupriavidus lacunae]
MFVDGNLKHTYKCLQGRHKRVVWIFRGQALQCFTPGVGIALLKRREHVVAKHDIAAIFEEIELIRHGVPVDCQIAPLQDRPDITGHNKPSGMVARAATTGNPRPASHLRVRDKTYP